MIRVGLETANANRCDDNAQGVTPSGTYEADGPRPKMRQPSPEIHAQQLEGSWLTASKPRSIDPAALGAAGASGTRATRVSPAMLEAALAGARAATQTPWTSEARALLARHGVAVPDDALLTPADVRRHVGDILRAMVRELNAYSSANSLYATVHLDPKAEKQVQLGCFGLERLPRARDLTEAFLYGAGPYVLTTTEQGTVILAPK